MMTRLRALAARLLGRTWMLPDLPDPLYPWAQPDADVAGDLRQALHYPEAGGWGP